jgi:hypothetical protein
MSAATAAIKFALSLARTDHSTADFLRNWNEGEFDKCREFWPEAPEEVYIGADPLHPKTKEMLLAQQNLDRAALDGADTILMLPQPTALVGGAVQYTAKLQIAVRTAILRFLKGQPVQAWKSETGGILSNEQREALMARRGESAHIDQAIQNMERFNTPLIAIDCSKLEQ